jgi:D-serine deaminase-like pyridoxal phosphate-dependent protein
VATRLIFIHGRNQQGKDPVEVRRQWFDALSEGFEQLGLDVPLAEDDTIFPFFGDALHELTKDEETLDEADEVLGDEGHDPETEDAVRFGREVLTEVLDGAGVSAEAIDAEIDPDVIDEQAIEEAKGGGALTWEWVHTGLSILDRFIPGASGASVAYATNDVAQYLKDDVIRAEIDGVVAEAFHQCEPGDRLVVVAHSLGSVIAYNLLAHGGLDQDYDVAAFVTIGSPLGVTAIRRAVSPMVHPSTVDHWLNAYDTRDVVALYPLDHRHFAVSPPILNHGDVDNETINHHKIEGYLNDPTIALTVHTALTSGRIPPVLERRRRVPGDPTRLVDLTTPALVVESSVFEANCAAMDSVRPGLALRPHVKAFKSTALAKRLAADRHTAFCAATPREIEGLVAAGLTSDLLLANETLDTGRLGELSDDAQITVAVDSDATLDAAIIGGIRSVLIDVNVGLPRCGCRPEDAGRLADRARRAGLEVRGVMGYEGHLMMVEDRQERVEKVGESMALLLAAADDVGGEVISGGGTGTFDTNTWCTEIQAGSYCLMDTHYDGLDLPFSIALEILATVISIHPKGWVIADAGLKAQGMDHGDPTWAHGRVMFCSDEHVTLIPDDPTAWSVGDLIRLQPAHVDPTVARHREMWLLDGEDIIDRWPVDLRHW